MARKQLLKHFSFAFLGEGWEEGYINFKPFSLGDIANSISLASSDPNNIDPEKVKAGLNDIISLLEEKFIDGKYPNDDGTLDDIAKEELKGMPNDILQAAMNFLSQSETTTLTKPTE
jgi:hypothetical protein